MAGFERSGLDDDAGRAVRRLLAAAASDGDGDLGAAFAARVAARAAAAPAAPALSLLGAAAWRLLPAVGALVVAVAAWTGYESVRLAAAEEATLTQAVDRDGGGAVLAMLLVGGDVASAAGGGQ